MDTPRITRDEIYPYTSSELEAMPTLAVGHFENLKVEEGEVRWWLSRMSREDGETHRVRCERLTRGCWVVSGEFEPLS